MEFTPFIRSPTRRCFKSFDFFDLQHQFLVTSCSTPQDWHRQSAFKFHMKQGAIYIY